MRALRRFRRAIRSGAPAYSAECPLKRLRRSRLPRHCWGVLENAAPALASGAGGERACTGTGASGMETTFPPWPRCRRPLCRSARDASLSPAAKCPPCNPRPRFAPRHIRERKPVGARVAFQFGDLAERCRFREKVGREKPRASPGAASWKVSRQEAMRHAGGRPSPAFEAFEMLALRSRP